MGSDIEPRGARSPERTAELRAKLIGIEESVLSMVEKGIIAARATFTQLTESTDPSPTQLLNAAKAAESLHRMARDICGDPSEATSGPVVNVQVNSMTADAELVAAVAGAYLEIQKGNLERAEALIGDADDVIAGEIVD